MANWNETKERLKLKITEIADKNLFVVKEQKEELLSKLQVKLGQPREVILKIISEM